MVTNILVLASNPQGTERLRLNPEIREIEDALDRGTQGDRFDLRSRVAVRVKDLYSSIKKSQARIVHFCGHGTGSPGLVLETDDGQQRILNTNAIADLFKLFKNQVECVVLNACYSEEQAKEIRKHINYVVGTQREIRDDAAIAFSIGFYEAWGNGETIAKAFEFGKNRIQLDIYEKESKRLRKVVPVFSEEKKYRELPEHEVVKLLVKDGQLNSIINFDSDSSLTRQEIVSRDFIKKSPYKGLKKFTKDDKDLFFGRGRLVHKLTEALNRSNLLLVLGASGSGKSSVVRAGVIPEFNNLADDRYEICIFNPDRNPFESFKNSLSTKDISNAKLDFLNEPQKDAFAKTVKLLKEKHSHWLIFIDQFEELFTFQTDKKNKEKEEIRKNFLLGLKKIARANDSSIKLVLAMRSDFLEELGIYPEFAKIAQKHIHLVTDMERNELRQAITRPAAEHGIVFEKCEPDNLVEEIINDVQGQAGYLPLLQYTLDLLWQNNDLSKRELKMVTYRQLGGVKGALQKHVNQIYEQLSPEKQKATRQVFLKLVDVVNEDKSQVLKTVVSKRAIKSDFIDEVQKKTIDFLVKKNLLISDKSEQPTIEIAHEALLTSWDKLREWITDARETIALYNRLKDDAYKHRKLKKENPQKAKEDLWRGSKLERAIEFRDKGIFQSTIGELSDFAKEFIDASIVKKERDLKAKIRIRNRTILGLVISLGLISFAAILAFQQMRLAQLRESAAEAKSKLSSMSPIYGLVEAVAAAGRSKDTFGRLIPAVEDSLNAAIYQLRETNRSGTDTDIEVYKDNDVYFSSSDISPNRKYIARGTEKGFLQLWDVKGNLIGKPFKGHTDYVSAVRFSSNGKFIISASRDKTIRLWNLQGNQIGKPLVMDDLDILDVAVSPNGKNVWTHYQYERNNINYREMRVWDLLGNPVNKPFLRESGVKRLTKMKLLHKKFDQSDQFKQIDCEYQLNITKLDCVNIDDYWMPVVAFSPKGDYIVTGSKKNIQLWDWLGNPLGKPLSVNNGAVFALAFSPKGDYFVSGSQDQTIQLWNLEGNRIGNPFVGHKMVVRSLSFSPEGKYIVSYGGDIRIWDLEGRMIHDPLLLFPDTLSDSFSVTFDGNKNNIIGIGDRHSKTIEWNLTSTPINRSFGFPYKINFIKFSPDGENIISADDNFNLRLWDWQGNQIGEPFIGHKDIVTSIVFSNDGNFVASGSKDKTIKLWDLANLEGNQIGKDFINFIGHEGLISSIAFHPKNKYIASGDMAGDKSTVRLWDLQGSLITEPFIGHRGNIYSVAFSENEDKQNIISTGEYEDYIFWDLQGNLEYEHPRNYRISQNSFLLGLNSRIDQSFNDFLVAEIINNEIKISIRDSLILACKKLYNNNILIDSSLYDIQLFSLPNNFEKNREAARKTCLENGNWSNKEKAEFFIAEGNIFARSNSLHDWNRYYHPWRKTKRNFKKAKKINPELDLDPHKQTQKLAIPVLLNYGILHCRVDNIIDFDFNKGVKYFAEAKILDNTLSFKPKEECKKNHSKKQ